MQDTYIRSIMLLVRVLASKYNLTVELTNDSTASVTPSVLRVPRAWVNGVAKDREAAEMIEGVLDHECVGHGRNTQFEVMPIYARKGNTARFLLNALEDIRIEALAADIYPGTARNLASMVSYLAKQHFFGKVADVPKGSAKQSLCNAILVIGRARLLAGQDLSLGKLAAAHEENVARRFGSLWQEVWKRVELAPKQPTTTAVGVLVDQILALMGETAQAGMDGKDADVNGATGEVVLDPAAKAGAKAFAADPDASVVATGDLGEIAGKALASASPVASTIGKVNFLNKPRTRPIPEGWKHVGQRIKAHLGLDFESLMESKTESRKSVGLTGRRLHNGKVHRVRTLDARIMFKRIVAEGISTALAVLSDVSSSMDTTMGGSLPASRFEAAGGTVVALADLLELHDIPFSAYLFDDGLGVMKEFEESWSTVRNRAQAICAYGGSTFAAPALVQVLGDLAVREEERKLLVMVTDGDSSNMPAVEAAFADAQYLGIDIVLVLIGVGTDRHVAQYRRITDEELHVTNSLETLADTVMNAVRASL